MTHCRLVWPNSSINSFTFLFADTLNYHELGKQLDLLNSDVPIVITPRHHTEDALRQTGVRKLYLTLGCVLVSRLGNQKSSVTRQRSSETRAATSNHENINSTSRHDPETTSLVTHWGTRSSSTSVAISTQHKNSSRDEIANVNLLRRIRTRTSKYREKNLLRLTN